MSAVALPYLLPEPRSVDAIDWFIGDGESWTAFPSELPNWDSQTDLPVRCAISGDWQRFRASAGLPTDFPLACSLIWTSSTSLMRARFAQASVPELPAQLVLDGQLPAARVGGVLTLTVAIHVAQAWPTAPPAVACRAGALLYEANRELTLEAEGSLFPVAVVDFSRTAHDPDSSWYLSIEGQLDSPFQGVALLSLNSSDHELVAAVSSPKPSPEQRMLVDELSHQVAMQLIDHAVVAAADEELMSVDWPVDSVGDVLRQTLNAVGGKAPRDSTERRAWLAGCARRLGHGRQFR